MQGRTVGNVDLAAVKREFVRVTGLPVSVADDMFGGMPKVIKRKLQEADAERIAGTLRAIGAAATIEREAAALDDDEETDEGIDIIAAPLGNGPPTVTPGMAPSPEPAPAPKERMPWLRDVLRKAPLVLGTLAVVSAAVYFAPEVSGWLSSFRATEAPAPAVAKAAAAVQAEPSPLTFNPSLVHGPWRCVDQATGLGVYWNYAPDGGLVFHGDVLADRSAPATGSATGWRLEDGKLVHKHEQGEADTFNVAVLTLSRMRYVGDRGLEVECRRP